MTKFWILIVNFVLIVIIISWVIFANDLVNYANDKPTIFPMGEQYATILETARGKNYVNDNQKIMLTREFVITEDMKVSWVAVIWGEKKNFSNKSIAFLKKYSPTKIYITKIGDINLQGYIAINNIKSNGTLITSNIEEKSAPEAEKKEEDKKEATK